MDYISLGYNFKLKYISSAIFEASVTLQNAFVLTKYKGQDPEVAGGIPYFEYPRPRTISFRIGADF